MFKRRYWLVVLAILGVSGINLVEMRQIEKMIFSIIAWYM